jgi:MFS family permease
LTSHLRLDPTAARPAPWEERLLVPVVFLIFAVAVGNTTSGAIAQAAIADAFQAGAADVGAIVFGYGTTFAIMTALWGPLARRFGLGRCLTFGVALVAVGAGIAVVAPDLGVLVAARVIQGFGAGAIPTLTMALIARRLTGPARARALGINVAAVGMGFAGGPLVGGFLLELFGWRGAMALGLLVAPWLPILPRLAGDAARHDEPLDFPGMGLLAVTVGCLVLLINRLPVLGFGLPTGLLFAVGLAAALVLVARSRGRAHAALPLRILADPVLRRMMAFGYVGQTAFFGMLVLAPIVAARVHGVAGFRLGLVLLPMALVIAAVSPRNGRLQARIGRPATTAVALGTIGLSASYLCAVGPAAPMLLLELGLVAAGAGFALLGAPLANAVSERFPDADRSLALGMYNLAFFIGSASGGAIATGFVQAGLEVSPLVGRSLPGASTGMAVLAILPIATLAASRLMRGRGVRPPDPASAT